MRTLSPIYLLVALSLGCSSGQQGSAPTSSTALFSSRSAVVTKLSPDKIAAELTVCSWNVNYGLAGDPAMVAVMGNLGCEVLFLQETTPSWERAIRARLIKKFPHMKFVNSPGAGGIAVLSRIPFVAVKTLTPPQGGWFPAMLITLKHKGHTVQALNLHLRPPLSNRGSVVSGYFSTKKIRLREVQKYSKQLQPSLPTLVVGDFNEGTGGSAIAYLNRRGFRGALGTHNTWRWKTSFYITLRSKLDHILYNKRLHLKRSRVLKRGRSDHLPIRATLYIVK